MLQLALWYLIWLTVVKRKMDAMQFTPNKCYFKQIIALLKLHVLNLTLWDFLGALLMTHNHLLDL